MKVNFELAARKLVIDPICDKLDRNDDKEKITKFVDLMLNNIFEDVEIHYNFSRKDNSAELNVVVIDDKSGKLALMFDAYYKFDDNEKVWYVDDVRYVRSEINVRRF